MNCDLFNIYLFKDSPAAGIKRYIHNDRKANWASYQQLWCNNLKKDYWSSIAARMQRNNHDNGEDNFCNPYMPREFIKY
jgi:hypothetical protein